MKQIQKATISFNTDLHGHKCLFGRWMEILQNEMILVHLSIFLAAILFTQSIICVIQVCKQAFMSRSNPGRKAALVRTKFIPAVILGLALFGQTLYAGYFFVQHFIGLPF